MFPVRAFSQAQGPINRPSSGVPGDGGGSWPVGDSRQGVRVPPPSHWVDSSRAFLNTSQGSWRGCSGGRPCIPPSTFPPCPLTPASLDHLPNKPLAAKSSSQALLPEKPKQGCLVPAITNSLTGLHLPPLYKRETYFIRVLVGLNRR